ncbi:hypothetical protein [Chengkuizengella axinellae]|uniref:YtzI protein n=1 Tax=Chengkuizengella axinellae TaxID=3064388 RepID=A0ABT9IV57_9BACL|nr:hypothetical protein [Chengkuizengella sp. 2205SS18-9]MDP5273230.1 hypothetical protein [Chengkuizengella sp. 2205SS18-9]
MSSFIAVVLVLFILLVIVLVLLTKRCYYELSSGLFMREPAQSQVFIQPEAIERELIRQEEVL